MPNRMQCRDSLYILLSLTICQRPAARHCRAMVENRGLGPQCRAGSRLSSVCYRDQRIAAHSTGNLRTWQNRYKRPCLLFVFCLLRVGFSFSLRRHTRCRVLASALACADTLQKGGVPAAPSGTATLLRLSPNHQFCLRPILAVTDFRHPRLSWLDGRCVQGPGTYSPRHG